MKNRFLVYQSAITIVFFIFYTSIKAYATDYSISFAGSGASTLVESVLVQNITKGSTIIVPSGNTLRLTDAPNAVEQLNANDEGIRIYSNLVEEKSTISFYVKQTGNTQINAYSTDGQKVASLNDNLQEGKNSFQLSFAKGTYLIQVIGNGYSYTAKLISQSKSANNKIKIIGIGTVKTNSNTPKKSKSSVTTMLYSSGDRLIYKGYSGNLTTIVADIPTNSKTISFYFFECKDVDGNYYPIVKIGSQIWMTENLKTSRYRNYNSIINKTSDANWGSLTTAAFSEYSTPSKSTTYGKLYNWYALNDSRLIAPLGWHIPTDAEWTTLTDYLGGESVAGNKLKENGSIHWGNLNITATNETGFTALPGGARTTDGTVYDIGQIGYWWSNSPSINTMGWYRYLDYMVGNVSRGNYSKSGGMSVRCVKGDIQILTTSTVSDISTTSAMSGGNISYDGGEPITARGVCWSTSPNPTILDSKTTDGSSTGSFSSTITGLSVFTKYYIRAYATNNVSTVYGNELSFTTRSLYEDGLYITGTATGTTSLAINYRMATGLNEVTRQKRAGMYEKYVALEADKEFNLLLIEGGIETRYSAVLADFDTKGVNDQPTVILQKGTLFSGATVAAMKVKKSGLYHIILDLNTAKDLVSPLIIVAPVEWGVRGVNGDWGWKKMKASAFNSTTMVWDTTIVTTSASEFKFAYGGGWKIQLDDTGFVKASTNLGVDMLPDGASIKMPKATDIKVTLTWNLATGEISKSYAMAVTGNIIFEDPKTFVVGLSGNAFGSNTTPPIEWSDPVGTTLAVYDAANSTISNTTTKAGTYIYNIFNLKVDATKEFKVRVKGDWIGVSGATIVGETFRETDNFIVNTTATYTNIKFEVVWDGIKATSIKLTFTK